MACAALLLPSERRRAVYALFTIVRRIDDLGDAQARPDEKSARLSVLRGQLQQLTGPARAADEMRSPDMGCSG